MKTVTTLLSMALLVIVALGITPLASADVHVNGYYRGNGTYVQPHYRSSPDGLRSNNWSTYPNVNPYTGKIGTKRLSTSGSMDTSSYAKPSTLLSYSQSILDSGFKTGKPSLMPKPLPGPTYPNNFRGRFLL